MSEIVPDYYSGLAEAMLDEGVIRFMRPDNDDGPLKLQYCANLMGPPGSQLFDIATVGYAMTFRTSGLMYANGRLPSIIATPSMRPSLLRVIKDAYGGELELGNRGLPSPDLEDDQADEVPAVIFDTSLDADSIEIVDRASQHNRVVGFIALLDLQQGARTDLKHAAGVNHVQSVITLQQVLRYAVRTERADLSPDECDELMDALDPAEAYS